MISKEMRLNGTWGQFYGGFAWFVIWIAFNRHVESLKGFEKESKVIGFGFLRITMAAIERKQDSWR